MECRLDILQIVIMVLMSYFNPGDQANNFKNAVRWVVLLQMIPRCIRFFPLLAGQSRSGFVFETAWANFIVNIFIYLLASHVVGCSWYLFGLQVRCNPSLDLCLLSPGCTSCAPWTWSHPFCNCVLWILNLCLVELKGCAWILQRVNVCLQMACSTDNSSSLPCLTPYLDCGYKNTINSSDQSRVNWIANTSATNSCLVAQSATFPYGIYSPMGYQVVQEPSVVHKYIYSIFWGFLVCHHLLLIILQLIVLNPLISFVLPRGCCVSTSWFVHCEVMKDSHAIRLFGIAGTMYL